MYNDQYELGGGAYIGNYIMWAMTTEKGFNAGINDVGDPRTNFYFFKQHDDPSDYNNDLFTLPGRARPPHYNEAQYSSMYTTALTPYVVSNWIGTTTGIPANGFWGRDHGDNSGIPPDASLRTVAGVYPVGGAFGTPALVQTSGVAGALGAGIMPIVMSSYVHFIIGEASLTVPGFIDPTRASSEFNLGVTQSIATSTKKIGTYPIITGAQLTAFNSSLLTYAPLMLGKFNAATGSDKRILYCVMG
jgi:hypothetical protein